MKKYILSLLFTLFAVVAIAQPNGTYLSKLYYSAEKNDFFEAETILKFTATRLVIETRNGYAPFIFDRKLGPNQYVYLNNVGQWYVTITPVEDNRIAVLIYNVTNIKELTEQNLKDSLIFVFYLE